MEPGREETLALDLLLSEMGDVELFEHVDGHNPEHAGQTFDFAVLTTAGRWRAVEITMAADETEIATRAALDRLCGRIEARIRAASPDERGSFLLSGVIESRTRVNDIDVEPLVAVALASPIVDPSPSEGVELKRVRTAATLRVYPLFASASFMEGPENEKRLREALARKAPTLARAEAGGYETHLVPLQWALGSTEHWQRLLDSEARPQNPRFLWAVDLFPGPASLTRLIPAQARPEP